MPSDLAPIAPTFRLWRSSVTVEELTTTVARYLGEERTRTSFESFAGTHRISLEPKERGRFPNCCATPNTFSPPAIGAASSRLVLSLLLRKRTVSTKAALKLLDDANAAIQYNREILQTALDHVRQGIAVFDKDLQLVCWNRQFGEILDLPPSLIRVGAGWPISCTSTPSAARSPRAHRRIRRRRRSSAMSPAASPSSSASPNPASVIEVRANHMPDGGIVTTLHRHHAERGGRRSTGARQRDARTCGCASAPAN